MKPCLNCQTEYQPKKPHSKFCSANCRVAYNRKHPSGSVSKTQVQVLYNEMLEMVATIKQTQYDGPKFPDNFKGDEPTLSAGSRLPRVAIDAIKRKYMEDRQDATTSEEFKTWLHRLEADNRLSESDKQEVKNTRYE